MQCVDECRVAASYTIIYIMHSHLLIGPLADSVKLLVIMRPMQALADRLVGAVMMDWWLARAALEQHRAVAMPLRVPECGS